MSLHSKFHNRNEQEGFGINELPFPYYRHTTTHNNQVIMNGSAEEDFIRREASRNELRSKWNAIMERNKEPEASAPKDIQNSNDEGILHDPSLNPSTSSTARKRNRPERIGIDGLPVPFYKHTNKHNQEVAASRLAEEDFIRRTESRNALRSSLNARMKRENGSFSEPWNESPGLGGLLNEFDRSEELNRRGNEMNELESLWDARKSNDDDAENHSVLGEEMSHALSDEPKPLVRGLSFLDEVLSSSALDEESSSSNHGNGAVTGEHQAQQSHLHFPHIMPHFRPISTPHYDFHPYIALHSYTSPLHSVPQLQAHQLLNPPMTRWVPPHYRYAENPSFGRPRDE